MDSVSPVWSDKEVETERVIALGQAQYFPIIALPIVYQDGTKALAVRFRLTEEERAAIAAGADLLVTELTFGGRFTPIHIEMRPPGESPN